MKPAARRHTVGLILYLSWIHLVELREDRRFDEFGMQGSYSIYCMRADDREVGHANFFIVSLLNKGHTSELIVITSILLLNCLKEVVIDQVD